MIVSLGIQLYMCKQHGRLNSAFLICLQTLPDVSKCGVRAKFSAGWLQNITGNKIDTVMEKKNHSKKEEQQMLCKRTLHSKCYQSSISVTDMDKCFLFLMFLIMSPPLHGGDILFLPVPSVLPSVLPSVTLVSAQ